MKKTPLLDLGNVIVKVDFTPWLSWIMKKSGSEDMAHAKKVLSSSLFYDLEFGNISDKEFNDRLGKLFGFTASQSEMEENFCSIFLGLVDGMESLLAGLAEKGPVYCLSNTNKIHLNFLREKYPQLSVFTKLFASHEMHKRKPYPGIYRDVARDLNLGPQDLIFFDDVQANVQGALKAGLEAHLFEDTGKMAQVLKNFQEMGDKAQEGDFA